MWKNKRGGGGGGYRAPAPVDRKWSADKVQQVLVGILQGAGRLPGPGADKLQAMFSGSDTSAFKDTLYVELGREVVVMIRAAYQGNVLYTDGAPLINPQDLGPGICGFEAGMVQNGIEAIAEGVETVTGGLVSADDGGYDAAAIQAMLTLASALGA